MTARERYTDGMRRLAAGVTLVTAAHRGRRAGLTATSVCSVSADPPILLACVNRGAEAHDLILEAGAFAVSVLTGGHRLLADRFAGVSGEAGEERFEGVRWTELVTGAPLLEAAAAGFDCRVLRSTEAGTHTVFLGLVEAIAPRLRSTPLLYLDGAYGRFEPAAAEV